MSRLTGWLYSLRSLTRRDEADRGTVDEIAFHIDRQTRRYIAEGIPVHESRRRALREFGGVLRWREEAREARGSGWIDSVEQDVKQALRGLRRDTAFAAMAILTLALAIGANAAMFGIIDRLLLRGPEHVVAPKQLVRVYLTPAPTPATSATRAVPQLSGTSAIQPYALYLDARDQTSAFSATAAYTPGQDRVGVGMESSIVPVTYATADFFPLTGVHPALGRFYTPEEDRPPRGQHVAVLGYSYWQRAFAADSGVVGSSVTVDGRVFRIIGVAPRGFTGVERAPVDVWIPMSARDFDGASDWPTSWAATWVRVVGRLSVPRRVAEAQLTTVLRRTYRGFNVAMHKGAATVRPISYNTDGIEPPELGVARLLAGVAMIMLLVAAANMMNLVLARALRRRRELSVRIALGAGRWRIVRLLVVESVMVSMCGGLLGLAFAHWGGEVIRRTLLPNVVWSELPVDWRVLVWTAIATLVTGTVVALVPALQVSREDVVSGLRTGRTRSGGASHGAARTSLQIVQLASSVALLFTAGLFVRSLRNIRHLDLGFDADRVLAVNIVFPRVDATTKETLARRQANTRARYMDLRARVARLPGIAGASVGFGTPLFSAYGFMIRVPGIDSIPWGSSRGPFVSDVTPDYFKTVGTRLLRGRAFASDEGAGTAPVIIVNATMAKTLWPGAEPLGRCVILVGINGDACARVIGVAMDVHQWKLREDAVMQYYVPYGQDPRIGNGSMLLVRPAGDPNAIVPALTDVLRRTNPTMESVTIQSLEDVLDPQVRPWRVGAILFGLFGAVVMAVAAIGLFSVVSYLVVQRTHELGVRIALGAGRGRVLRLVMTDGLRTATIGAVIGVVVSEAFAPFLQPLLFDNSARDPLLLGGVGLGLLVVAMAASLWPSWRATRVDPLLALRAD